MGNRILTGEHHALGALFAAVDPSARYVTPKVQDLRFASLLSPFPDEAAALAALKEAGAHNIIGGSR